MTLDTPSMGAQEDDWSIPQWVKIAITFLAFNVGAIFLLAAASGQSAFFGLPTRLIVILFLLLAFLSVLLLSAFWFFPNHPFAVSVYWLLRFFREQIFVFALFGFVTLLTIRIPIFSFRGGIPFIVFLVLFLMAWLVKPVGLNHFPLIWMQRSLSGVRKTINWINSLPVFPLRVFVALLPMLIICSVIYFWLNARLSDYGPYSFWNDETGYWVWVRSFGHAGFNAGYNAPNELVAPATFNHYGEGSPIYMYIYGGIAQAVGWSSQLPILINFAILALAIFLFTLSTKLQPVQLMFTSLITFLTWPVLLYLPMTTHESLNQAIGFILAIIFFRLLTQREQVNLPARILFLFLVYLAALIRLSWGLLLIPVIFYSLEGKVFRRGLISVSSGLCLYLSALLITNYLVPPTNNSILVNIRDSLGQGPQILFEYVRFQFSQMFKFKQLNPNIAVMFQIVIILGWNLVRVVRSIRSRLAVATILESPSLFDVYNVTTLAVAGLLFYIQEGFYRTFTPSLLIVYLLQAARKDYKLLATLLTLNLLFFHSYMTFYAKVGDFAIIRQNFTTKFPERAHQQSAIEKWIRFEPAVRNPWCNTLLIPLNYYDSRLMVIPPGIGISYIQDLEALKTPLKSKYLLFDSETFKELDGRINTQLLESLSIGDLYYNLNSGCDLNK